MSFICAQVNENGIAHTVARLKRPVTGENIVPLPEDTEPNTVFRKKFDNGVWLTIVVQAVLTPEQSRLAELSAMVIADMTAAQRQEELLLRVRRGG